MSKSEETMLESALYENVMPAAIKLPPPKEITKEQLLEQLDTFEEDAEFYLQEFQVRKQIWLNSLL